MIKEIIYYFKARSIRAEVELKLDDWMMKSDHWSKPEEVYRRIKHELDCEINKQIIKHVTNNLNSGLLDEVAKKVIEDFDLKPLYEHALKENLKDTMFSGRALKPGSFVNHQLY